MKLFGALAGLAATLAVVPLKVEKKNDGEKKTLRISSLTWKAEYTSATETDEATLNISLLGGLKEILTKPAQEDDTYEPESSEDFVDFVIKKRERDIDLADIFSEPDADAMDAIEDIVEVKSEKLSDLAEDIGKIVEKIAEVVDDTDDLFADAVEFAVEFGKMSTSLLQRKFRIGYGRSAKIIDAMNRCGIVSAPNGSKPRQVLIDADQWKEIKENMGDKFPNAEENA